MYKNMGLINKNFGHVEFIYDEGSSGEDSYIIENNIFGVFDGFSGFDNFIDPEGKTGGFLASQTVKEAFSGHDGELKKLAEVANDKIRQKMLAANIDLTSKTNLWGTTAAVVRMNENYFEWLQTGDSLIFVINIDGSFKFLVKHYDHDKEVLMIWKQLADKKEKDIKPVIAGGPLIELRKKANVEYGALNGEAEAVSFLKSGIVDVSDITHIVIFTDGLFIPKEDPAADYDWKMFVKLYQEGGLRGVVDYVRCMEENDPYCWKYPRYKQFDDITAISISRKN